MPKHQRTAGMDYRLQEINGALYKIRPLVVGVYAAMEAYIVSLRCDPLTKAAEAVGRLDKKHHRHIWDAAMREATAARIVTAEESARFENSIQGLAWKLWQTIKEDHPEIDSTAAALNLIAAGGPDRLVEITRAVDIGSGVADLGESSGQEPNPEVEQGLAGQ